MSEKLNVKKIHTKIGSGAYGTVYKYGTSKQIQTNQHCVVKIIPVRYVYDGEVRALQNIGPHPNIVRLLDHAWDTKEFQGTILMTNAGQDLFEYQQENKLDHDEIKSIIRQVVQALQHIHAAGWIHCDLRPENIGLKYHKKHKRHRVILFDFGLAKQISSEYTGHIGCADYLTPEGARDEPFTAKTDIWAVGCLVFEMIVGRTPLNLSSCTLPKADTKIPDDKYEKYDWDKINHKILEEPLNLEACYTITKDPHIIDFVSKCLNRRQEARPSAAELLNHPFLQTQISLV